MRSREAAYFVGLAVVFIAVLGLVGLPLSTQGGNVATAPPTGTASSSMAGHLYNVTFYDGGPCNSLYPRGPFFERWGVQLGDWSLTEPSNITLSQISENGYSWGSFNLTTIVFSVPDGTYHFTIYPKAFMTIDSPDGFVLGGPSGVVSVNDSDVTIYAGGSNAPTCGM